MAIFGLITSWLTGKVGKWVGIAVAALIVLGTLGGAIRRDARKDSIRDAQHRADRDFIATRRRIDNATREDLSADAARQRLRDRLRTVR